MLTATSSKKAFSTGIKAGPAKALSTRTQGAVSLKVDVIPAKKSESRHVVFLHGLFGKGQSFQFIAKAKALQEHFTCHLVDLRNHGASEWDPEMGYKSLAGDIRAYFEKVGLEKERVSLVGHSLGAKTAMSFACMYPGQVSRLVSLDASPVNRGAYPHLNATSEEMVRNAIALGCLKGLTLPEAVKKIKSEIADPILQSALLFNLNKDCSFQVNLQAIWDNQEQIFGFPDFENTFEGPCLMLNGAQSFQREVLDDVRFYKHAFPGLKADDIVMIEEAGHGLHFEKPTQVRRLIHSFLLSEETSDDKKEEPQTNRAQLAAL